MQVFWLKAGRGELSFSQNRQNIRPWLYERSSIHYKETRYIKFSILDISHVKMFEFELMKRRNAESAVN
ncbi:MAG: hypothetical protein IPP79_05190 [Chitinophagaceae bacterium]|nr:hypothetical protein [Chitinophagaceae bacterium]